MDCRQFRDRIESIALTPLGDYEQEWVEHLESCSSCREKIRQLQDAWLTLAATLPQSPANESLEETLMQRVESARPTLERTGAIVVWKYVLAASVLFLLASLTYVRLGLVGAGEPKLTDSNMQQIRTMAQQMDKIEGLERVFASNQLKYVSLKSEPDASPAGYLVLDPMSGQVHFFGRNLVNGEAATQESSLRVWLYDRRAKVLTSEEIKFQGQPAVGTAILRVGQIEDVEAVVVTKEAADVAPVTPSDEVLLRCDLD